MLTFPHGEQTVIDLSRFVYTNDDPTVIEKGAAYVQSVTWEDEKQEYVIHYLYVEHGETNAYEMMFSDFMRYCLNGEIALIALSKEETDNGY